MAGYSVRRIVELEAKLARALEEIEWLQAENQQLREQIARRDDGAKRPGHQA